MLVRTPTIRATESLLGYVLRVSETNGYDTPWQVLSHARISRRQAISTDFPLDRLASILNCPVSSLETSAYARRSTSRSIEYKALNHSLGHHLRKNTFRLNAPALCPRCVSERGFIEAHWDIRLITACSRHSCTLINRCPSCCVPISWFRPGLLKCQCGADWAHSSTTAMAPDIADLQLLLTAKIIGQSELPSLARRFPGDLVALPLNALIVLLSIIGDVGMRHTRESADPVSCGASMLCDWPKNYERFLTLLDAKDQCRNLIKALNRTHLPNQALEFLYRPAMARVASKVKPATSTKKQKSTEPMKKRAPRPLPLPLKESIGDRQAAAAIGLPVSTLNALRASGHFEVCNLPTPKSAYHRIDLENFIKGLLRSIPKEATTTREAVQTVMLSDVLRNWKFRNPEGKRDLVIAIMEGAIVPIANLGENVRDIQLPVEQVTNFLLAARSQMESMSLR